MSGLRYVPDHRLSKKRREALLMAFTALETCAADCACRGGNRGRARRIATRARDLITAFGVRSQMAKGQPRFPQRFQERGS